MVSATSSAASGLVSLLSTSAGGDFSSTSSASVSAFGPDFLLSAIGSNNPAAGSAYNSLGQPYSPPPGSQAAAARDDALSQSADAISAGEYDTAISLAQGVLKNYPQNLAGLYYVGHSYLQEGDFANATKYLQQAASLSSDTQIQNELDQAQILPKGTDAVLARVNQLLKNPSTVTQGLALTTKLLDQDPSNTQARLVLVDYYDKGGFLNLATAELAGALSAAPPEELQGLVGRTKQLAADHPADALTQGLLGQAYARVGDYDSAGAAFSNAINLSANDTELQSAIKTGYADALSASGKAALNRDDTSAALAAFQQALSLSADDTRKADIANLQYSQGSTALRQGNLRGALTYLDQARNNLPSTNADDLKANLLTAYNTLATKFGDVGDLKRVINARSGAYLLDTTNDTTKRGLADANDAYGQSLASSGDYYGAIKAFSAALKLYADDTNYAAHLTDAQGHL